MEYIRYTSRDVMLAAQASGIFDEDCEFKLGEFYPERAPVDLCSSPKGARALQEFLGEMLELVEGGTYGEDPVTLLPVMDEFGNRVEHYRAVLYVEGLQFLVSPKKALDMVWSSATRMATCNRIYDNYNHPLSLEEELSSKAFNLLKELRKLKLRYLPEDRQLALTKEQE